MTVLQEETLVRPLAPGDRPQVLALLTASLSGGPTGRRTEQFFGWKHESNVFGPSLGLVAQQGDKIVGVRLFMRWGLTLGGRPVRAVRAVDTATLPRCQGQGIFRRLTLAALEQARADTDLVFNTPNGNSRPGYLKMGWQEVGTVPVRVCPVRPTRLARGLLAARGSAPRGGTAGLSSPLPRAGDVVRTADFAALLAEARPGQHTNRPRLATVRSLDFYGWRYADAPDLDYRALTVHNGGRLAGVGIGRLRWRGPLAEFTLSEVVVRHGDRRAAADVLRAARRCGADHVASSPAPDSADAAVSTRCGYLTVPRAGLGLVTRPLSALPVDATDLASWSLSLGDLEVF